MSRRVALVAGFLLALAALVLFHALQPVTLEERLEAALALEARGEPEAAARLLLPLLEPGRAPAAELRQGARTIALRLARRDDAIALALAAELCASFRPGARAGGEGPEEAAARARLERAMGLAYARHALKIGSPWLWRRARAFGVLPRASPPPITVALLASASAPEAVEEPLAPGAVGAGGAGAASTAVAAIEASEERPGAVSARSIEADTQPPAAAGARPEPSRSGSAPARPAQEGQERSAEAAAFEVRATVTPGPDLLPASEAPVDASHAGDAPSGPDPATHPPELKAVCAAAAAGDFELAIARLEAVSEEALYSLAGDQLAGTVYFNASILAARAGDCGRALAFARAAAAHDDPWSSPSNLGWLRTLERVRNCADFNLTTVLQVVRLKSIPVESCASHEASSTPRNLKHSQK